MIYQDGINFVEDADPVEFYPPYGTTEDYTAIQSMAGHNKDHDFQAFNLAYNPNQYFTPSDYESPVTDQNELAALPGGYANEYDDGFTYGTTQTEDYSHIGLPQVTSGQFSTIPSATAMAYTNQNVTYSDTNVSKKRKASFDSYPSDAPAPKRINVQDPNGDYYDLKSEPSPYSSFVPTPTTVSAPLVPYHHMKGSPRVHAHQHSTSNASQISVAATAPPYTPTVSPSFTTANTEHSPHAPATPGARPASAASNPKLVRTSTIPHHSPQAVPSSMTLIGHTQTFNPYTLFSPDSKARLKLEGNLDDVANKWTAEELEARRKIVVFNREQNGNDIKANFDVVSQTNWKNEPRSVSCIWWEEKKEAYVTSVDTILLLEGIVGARFTVEEKNRIRRNLEGFKPDTVSKAKPETEEFFKVIMGFPNPKPRNIEKDVKVFPWKVLSVALQKIISKYSASYASTAGSIQHQTKMYRPVDQYEYGYSSGPAPEFHGNLQMASFPVYETQGRLSAPVTPVSHLRLAPHMSHQPSEHHSYGYAPGPGPATQHTHMVYHGQHVPNHGMEHPQYWQPVYSQDRGMPMAPVSAPPAAYSREMIDAANYNRNLPMGHYVHAAHH